MDLKIVIDSSILKQKSGDGVALGILGHNTILIDCLIAICIGYSTTSYSHIFSIAKFWYLSLEDVGSLFSGMVMELIYFLFLSISRSNFRQTRAVNRRFPRGLSISRCSNLKKILALLCSGMHFRSMVYSCLKRNLVPLFHLYRKLPGSATN